MAPSADDIRSAEQRVADLQRELDSVQSALHAAERVAEAGEVAKARFRRFSRSAVAVASATLLLILISLKKQRQKRQS